MFQFKSKHFVASCGLFLLLVYIALFVNDQFVRPFLGDVLVVIWLYLLLQAFLKIKPYTLAFWTLLFSYAIELAQRYNVLELLGLQDIKVARIILGSTFDWFDILAYTLGWLVIVIGHYVYKANQE